MGGLDDRYELGGRKLGRCLAEVKSPPGRLLGAWDIAPDLERILGEALFGTHLEAAGADAGAAGDSPFRAS